ncbi:MAG: PAS domain S-box protein [Gallionella sp.]|nr:MAG: PAS domain S-box protein [Gallionella sp.]
MAGTDERNMKNKKLTELLNTPLGVTLAITLLIAAVELFIMLVAHDALIHGTATGAYWEFGGVLLLTALVAPALYFLVFREMRESEERFRQILATAPNAIVIVDVQGRITDWNPAAQQMFGYSREEAVGQPMHQLLPPHRYRGDAEHGFARFRETGEGPVVGKVTEISALRKSGSEFPVELSISAIKLKGCWSAIGIIHDITERKRAERAFGESIERYRQLFDSMSSGVAVYTARNGGEDFILKEMNRAGERICQTSREQAVGRGVLELFPGVIEMGLFEVFRQVWSTGKPQHQPDSFYRDNRLSIWVVNYVYKLPSGEIVAIYDDVTKRKQVEELQRQNQEQLRVAMEDTIGAIAATLEQRDPYTAGHQRRVAQLAAAIGEEMGLAHELIEGIHFGGLIHDIGKISVPAEILGKPGRLTGIEFGLIKTHAEAGYEIVKGIAFPWPVADMVRQHHERMDGSGYPLGLKGEQIALEARILAVADVVEAMSANRPYRPGLGMDAAIDEITRGRGAQLDPVAVDACLRVVREKGFVFTE